MEENRKLRPPGKPGIVKGEFHENTVRKDFLPSEMVAKAKALKPQEEMAARERQAKAGPKEGKGRKSGSGKLPEAVGGKTREKGD